MKIIFFLLFAAFTFSATAQQSKDEVLQDSVFAWGSYAPLKPSSYPRTFTPYQQKLPDVFTQWIRKSYIPIGAIDKTFAIAEPNDKGEVSPYVVGVNAEMWKAAWDNTGKKVIRTPHSSNPVYILTNHILDAAPVPMLTIPGRAVFMRRSPEIEKAFKGSSERINAFVKQLQLENHPQIGKYIIQYFGCDGDGCQPGVAVYLSPNNKLPIRQLTRGEVLEIIEQSIPAEITVAKNKLKSTFGHRPESLQQEYKRFDETVLPKWKANLEKLKKQYSNSLQVPAELKNSNGISMINIYNGDDIFDTEDAQRFKNNTYGIYTYEDDVLQKSKQDQPLWICIGWMPAGMQHDFYSREIHRSMVTHFNFDYVYNYFFAPEKNNKQPYTLLNPEIQKENIANIQKEKNRMNTPASPTPAGVHYFEDFSANNAGQKPQGWYNVSVGEPSVVITPDGLSGKWLDLRTQYMLPNNFKRPLPKDFQFEFDVACSDFSTNTGGALLLNINNKVLRAYGDEGNSPNPVDIDFNIKAGHSKWTSNPTGGSNILATYKDMPGNIRYAGISKPNLDFTEKKNKVHIIITKKGNQVRGYVDGKEIMMLDKYGKEIPGYNELPQNTQFTSFHFKNTTNGKENRVYISNVKITTL
ncbi:MAG: hypothetical protein QM668_22120 [Agriterribacter sp.]